MASSTTFCFGFPYFSTMLVFPYLKTVSVVVTNDCLISSKYPHSFSIFSTCKSDSLGSEQMVLDYMISVLDLLHHVNSIISYWYSPPC